MTPLLFECEGEQLAGWLHPAAGSTGILIVQGGAQTRVGPHRLFVRLAAALCAAGHPVMRFDRRGIGDSGGDDRGFAQAGPDICAALQAFRHALPKMRRTIGVGLCDGATALLLAGAPFDKLALLNPWAIESEDAPSSAADRAHYRRRLRQADSWRRLLTGKINPFPVIGSLFVRPAAAPAPASLEIRVRRAIDELSSPPLILLSDRDRTAAHFAATAGKGLPARLIAADHAFSSPSEFDELLDALSEQAAAT